MRVLSIEELDKCKPEELAGKHVTKETFFAVVPTLQGMSSQAAEDTYQRWLITRRVVEHVITKEDPTGIKEDERAVYVEARYINLEKRRYNRNQRMIEEARKAVASQLPPALR